METTELRPRETPTGNGAPARLARKKFDPTQLFAQRDRLPWFWFFVAVAVTGVAGVATRESSESTQSCLVACACGFVATATGSKGCTAVGDAFRPPPFVAAGFGNGGSFSSFPFLSRSDLSRSDFGFGPVSEQT